MIRIALRVRRRAAVVLTLPGDQAKPMKMSDDDPPVVSTALFRGLAYGIPLAIALWALIFFLGSEIVGQ